MPRLSVAWVRLQRVPPDMRILTPGLRFFSTSSVRRPASAARMAAIRPAAPAPITTTSRKDEGGRMKEESEGPTDGAGGGEEAGFSDSSFILHPSSFQQGDL